MAARFWVGGTGTWDASDTTHWAASSGGAGGQSVPVAGDDVTIDASSGAGTITVATDFSIRSLTCGAMGMTLDFSANNNSPTLTGAITTSGTGTRTINWGSGTFTLSGSNFTIFANGTTTNQTMTGSATFNFTYSGGTGTRAFQFGGTGANTISTTTCKFNITAGTDIIAMSGTNTGTSNLDFTGFSGTWSSTSTTITIANDLTLSSTMTNSVTAGIQWTVNGRSGVLRSNGKAFASSFIINGTGTTVTLFDDFVTTSTVTLTNGTLDTNGQTCSWGLFSSSNSNTRVLTLGASTISLTGTGTITPWNCQTSTNMTLNAGTSTLVFATGGQAPTFQGGGLTYYNLSITNTSGGFTLGQSNTFNNVTFAQGSGNRSFSLGTSTTQTINGLLTLTGFTVNQSRLRIQSNTFGTQCTFALGATGTVAITNTDFSDIAFTGTNAPVSGTSLGDVGGNSGITFDAARTVYWVNGTGNMSSTSNWSLTSGGAIGAAVPLCQDTLIFDANSFSAPGQTVTQDIYRCGTINFSTVTNSPTWSFADTSSAGLLIVGNLTLSPSMSVTCASATGADVGITLTSRASQTWANAGITWGTGFSFSVNAPGGTYTLQDNFVMSDATRTFTCTRGTFNANGYNVTCGLFNSSNSETRTLTMGSGTWTLTGTGTVWNVGTTTNLTFSGASSTIIFTDASAASKTFSTGTGAAAYGNFIALPGGAGAIVFNSNDKSFNSLNIFGPKTVTFNAGTTYTVLSPNFSGSPGSVVTVQSSSAGSPFILSTPSGYVRATYASIKDSTAQGGAYFEAVNSTSVSGNTGWNFATASAGGGLRAGKKFAAFGGARPINKVLDSKLHGYRKLGG